MPTARFRVNTELTAAKAFEDEVVIINTATGRYYDLTGSGPLVWTRLQDGASVDDIVASLAAAYDVPESTAREDVERLLDELSEEQLVVSDEGVAAGDGHHEPGPASTAGEYAPPALTRYTDMEDLLAADPPLPSADVQVRAEPAGPPPEAHRPA